MTTGNAHFSWVGHDLPARMLSTLRRRTLDGERAEQSPFNSIQSAWPSDVAAFLEHRTDDELIENLVFAFLRAERGKLPAPAAKNAEACMSSPAYCLLKQLFASETHRGFESSKGLRPDLSVTALLSANRAKDAMEVAMRRLRVAGLKPLFRLGWDLEGSVRLGAALLIPIWDVARVRKFVVDPPQLEFIES